MKTLVLGGVIFYAVVMAGLLVYLVGMRFIIRDKYLSGIGVGVLYVALLLIGGSYSAQVIIREQSVAPWILAVTYLSSICCIVASWKLLGKRAKKILPRFFEE